MRLRGNLLVFGCALALVVSIAVVLFVNFAPRPGEGEPNLGLIAILWLAAFFLPPFFAAARADDRGALYGLVIGIVPLVVALLFGYSIPWPFAIFFYAFAPLGGFLGQRTSRSRSAG